MPNVNMINFSANQAGSADLQAQQIALQRRQQLAEMLRSQAMQPSQTQIVSGRAVPISPLETFAKLATAYLSNKTAEGLDQKTLEIGAEQRKRQAEALRALAPPEAGLGDMTPQVPAGAPEDTSAGFTPPQVPEYDPATRARWVQLLNTASANPKLGEELIKQELTAPKWSTDPKYNQNGQGIIFNDKGGSKVVDGFTARDRLENVNGVWQNPYKQGENSFAPQDPNKPFGMGPNGIVPNMPYQQYELSKARAGASNVSVNTATKPFLSELGKTAAASVDADFSGAKAAVQTLQNVEQIRSGLGKAIVGPGANARVTLAQVGQMLGVGGKDASEQLQNTRSVMQGLARQELSAAGQMKGQGQITESERGILRKAESGQINEMTAPEINTLLGALEKTARYRISLHNTNMERLRADPNAAGVVDYMQVQVPQSTPAATAAPKVRRYNPETGRIE